ncbi:UNVERIFIED_CONTAM: hypothetical protein RMT77_016416 [Armadillidium vulgare]
MVEEMGVATVDGALHQQQQQQQQSGGGTIHSSDTLTLEGSPAGDEGSNPQYRQSGSHLSYVSEKGDTKSEAQKQKEKESLEDKLERSTSGLSGRFTSYREGLAIPYDPQCGCIAPIPPYPTTPK